MEPLSQREVGLISWLEFHKKYFFTSSDVDSFAKTRTQRYNMIKNLVRKKRIIKLNKVKYYLIPIRAKSGAWAEHPFIIVDEMMDGKDYIIGGWAAANYWKLSDQIPFRIDIFTTQRQGSLIVMNTKLEFHRTSANKLEKAVIKQIQDHEFRILSEEETNKWLKSHQ